MMPDFNECDCTLDFDPDNFEEPIIGKTTKMDYQGKGVWVCPACKKSQDLHSAVYSVRIEYKSVEGCMEATIIPPIDERLQKPVQEKNPDWTNLKCLEENINDDCYNSNLKTHEVGTFDSEILWYEYRTCHEYDEYDIVLEIFQEKKVN